VVFDPARRELQQFMREQQDSGMLLVMASKNNEADVLETFARHPEMPLQLRHFVAWKLNWESKSANLSALAAELSLGLDSFILLDDSAKECAEAAESIPEVLAIALPATPGEIPHLLDQIWAFDHLTVTEEDRNRSAHYKTSLEFGRELKHAASLEGFINALDLRVTIRPITPDQLARVSQLTQRTNQFNFTATRRTESEISGLLESRGLEGLAIDVSDRFGDYGLTGVVFFHATADALEIETLLLSCRVLGRGVEHRVIAHLGSEALLRGLNTVIVTCRLTPKNEPARRFLREIGDGVEEQTEHGFIYRLPAAALRDLRWQPSAEAPHPVKASALGPIAHKRPDYLRIARELSTPAQILDALRRESGKAPSQVPMQQTEAALAQIWCELLQKPGVSPQDNFFDLGGHSLLAVLLIVRVRETFGLELAIDDVYSANLTLGELASKIEAAQLGDRAEYDALYKEIEAMSDEEVRQLLTAEDPGVSLP
jgi:FkbH-like protein